MNGKKLISILLALVLVLSMFPVLTASAADYNISICGKKVTDANKNDVLGDGSVRFEQAGPGYYLYINKSVSWNNGTSTAAINSRLGGTLYIIATGDVTVQRTVNGGAICHNDKLFIVCGGEGSKLTAIGTGSSNDGAIYADGEIDIADAVVDARGGQYGIHAGGKLEITTSTVAAKGTYSAIYADGGLSLDMDMGVVRPEAAQIFGADIRNADGSRATDVLLQPVESYDIWICGRQVTSANCKDVLGDGAFVFDPEYNELTIRGDCEYMGNVLVCDISGLSITAENEPTLKAIDGNAIVLYQGATIGNSKLTLRGLNGIFLEDCTLTIGDSDVDARSTGSGSGIRGGSGAPALEVVDSHVVASGGTEGIYGMAYVDLVDCFIKTPEGGEIKDGRIVDQFGDPAPTVEIDSASITVLAFDVEIAAPAVGRKPATTATVTSANIVPYRIVWYCLNEETSLGEAITDPNYVFEAGRCYSVDIYVKAGEDTAFALDVIGTVNGKDAFAVSIDNKVAFVSFEWDKLPAGGGELKNPFVDVAKTDYFYDAVLWAFNSGVTTGLDATHFGPYATCTRGQIVTFLWRALGEPAPMITENPFVDVKESDYYYKAVLWAYENGVTTGTDETHFAPGAFCKREHAVAFLYRAAHKPEYTTSTNPFVDVPAGAYYYDAVLWAVEKNITKGIDATHFGPSNSCQRCQIVTFLYRFMNP